MEQVFETLLDEYIDRNDPKKKAARRESRRKRMARTDAERSEQVSGETRRSRHVPAQVREEVLRRDGYQCTYVSPEGRRCESRWDLEIDHEVPYGKSGEHSEENCRVRCRALRGP